MGVEPHDKRIMKVLLLAVLSVSCTVKPALVQPGAPGQPTRVISARQASDLSRIPYTAADVRFMQGMIGHHAQALEMTALVPSRTPREDMRLLASRIELSQADEIQMMQDWLRARGAQLPSPHADHGKDAILMPGMLTAEEMTRSRSHERR